MEANVVAAGASIVEALLQPQGEAPLDEGGTVHKVKGTGLKDEI
jgi:hypothetical protein